MKRKIIFAITSAVLISVFTFSPAGIPMGTPMGEFQYMADAAEAYQKVDSSSGTVTAADVNLRNGPATTFDIICKLKKDQKVTVMGKLGNWYAVYVGANGNVGSISAQYLKLDKAASTSGAKPASAAKPSTAAADTQTVAEQVKDVSKDEQELLDLVNKERKDKGLKALQFDAGLMKIARLKAADMKTNGYFSHTSAYYGTPFDMMKKYGIKFSTAGEDIAGNQSAEKAVKAWLNDSSNNIYNDKFTHTGIGIADSPVYGRLYVEMFIRK